MIHAMAVELFKGFKRTAQAGGATTDATWEDLSKNPNLKRIMYALAHDAFRAQREWFLANTDRHNSGSYEVALLAPGADLSADEFEQLMRKPL